MFGNSYREAGHSSIEKVDTILMSVDKTMVILRLVFVCGLLAGVLLTGLLSPQQYTR